MIALTVLCHAAGSRVENGNHRFKPHNNIVPLLGGSKDTFYTEGSLGGA
jgi:hypothetical protein